MQVRGSILFAVLLLIAFVLVGKVSQAQEVNRLESEIKNSESSTSKFKGEWRLSLGHDSFSELTDESQRAGVSFRPRGKYNLGKMFILNGDIVVRAISGRVQDRFDDGRVSNLVINRATAEIRPLSWVMLEGGMISYDYLSNILLEPPNGSPGAIGGIEMSPGAIKLSFLAQQSIPSSVTRDSERTDKEELPSFATETLSAKFYREDLQLEGSFSHFSYKSLPSKVAASSYINGNTIIGFSEADSEFVYDFDGFAGSVSGRTEIFRGLEMGIASHWVENTESDAAFSRGMLNLVEVGFQIRNVEVKPAVYDYFVESDAIPSYYSRKKFGGTNREGIGYRLTFEFKEMGFRVIAENIQGKTINDSPVQGDFSHYSIGLETFYASF